MVRKHRNQLPSNLVLQVLKNAFCQDHFGQLCIVKAKSHSLEQDLIGHLEFRGKTKVLQSCDMTQEQWETGHFWETSQENGLRTHRIFKTLEGNGRADTHSWSSTWTNAVNRSSCHYQEIPGIVRYSSFGFFAFTGRHSKICSFYLEYSRRFLMFLFAICPVPPLSYLLSDIWVKRLNHKINGKNNAQLTMLDDE